MNRKIIFECRVGSHLFGTNTPASDEDFCGVFLPSREDLLGLDKCPAEWSQNQRTTEGPRNSAGDVDRKYYSIQRFLQLAIQGQPGQLEMLFAPATAVLTATPEWQQLTHFRSDFLSKSGIRPFLGFAMAQAHKATIKGENLNLIRELIAASDRVLSVANDPRIRLSAVLSHHEGRSMVAGIPVSFLTNWSGATLVEVAGRQFDPGIMLRSFLEALRTLETRYGKRSEAAATAGYDYKSLSHAVRLISEAEEYLTTGTITLPRPDAAFILAVKQGQVDRDWFAFLTGEIERIERDVLPQSGLPDKPDEVWLEDTCVSILHSHLLDPCK